MIKFHVFSPTFQVNIYGVSTPATVAIHNKMHVISLCNTQNIFSHNCDNYVLYAKLYLVKNSFLAYFMSRTMLVVIDHTHTHISTNSVKAH